MKIIKEILQLVCILAVTIILGLAVLYIYKSIDKTDTFYLKEAALNNPNHLYEMEKRIKGGSDLYSIVRYNPAVFVHRIKQGKGCIVAYRWFSSGKVLAMDDERFEKLTIWLSNDDLQDNMKLNLADHSRVIAVYTAGNSAWYQLACSGYITSGELDIKRSASSPSSAV